MLGIIQKFLQTPNSMRTIHNRWEIVFDFKSLLGLPLVLRMLT